MTYRMELTTDEIISLTNSALANFKKNLKDMDNYLAKCSAENRELSILRLNAKRDLCNKLCELINEGETDE